VIIHAVNATTPHQYSYTDSHVAANNTYYYWIEGVELNGTDFFRGPVTTTIVPTPNNNDNCDLTQLVGNGPNPFSMAQSTTIAYSLKGTAGVPVNATLVIYNLRGQVVKTLFNGQQLPGKNKTTRWDGTNDNGRHVGSGIYFYKLSTEDYSCMKKAILIK
jgi:hypothetical protein